MSPWSGDDLGWNGCHSSQRQGGEQRDHSGQRTKNGIGGIVVTAADRTQCDAERDPRKTQTDPQWPVQQQRQGARGGGRHVGAGTGIRMNAALP